MSPTLLSLLADHASADELTHLAAAKRLTEHRPAQLPPGVAEVLAEEKQGPITPLDALAYDVAELEARLADLSARLAAVEAALADPPRPPPRWPGDRWAA